MTLKICISPLTKIIYFVKLVACKKNIFQVHFSFECNTYLFDYFINNNGFD